MTNKIVGVEEVPHLGSLFGYDAQVDALDYDIGIATSLLHSNFTDHMRHRSLKQDLVEHIWSKLEDQVE